MELKDFNVETTGDALTLTSFHEGSGMDVKIICKESEDAERRWDNFWKGYAKATADYYIEKHGIGS